MIMNPRFSTSLICLSIAVIGLLTASVVSGPAQGIGFRFTASSYTAVLGQNITASVSMEPVSDPYEVPTDSYGDTVYGKVTDWAMHSIYEPLYEEIEVTDTSGNLVDALELNWATGVTGTETFSISNPNSGVAGPDFVGYLFTDNNDPNYGNDYYWALCYPSDFSGYSAVSDTYALQAFTNFNPNTVISVEVNGSTEQELVESTPAQSTSFRIYRTDNFNNRQVYYTISGAAISGTDYSADFSSGYVSFTAGGPDYIDIPVTTIVGDNLDAPVSLTLTLSTESNSEYESDPYQIDGGNNSATINFMPYPTVSISGSTTLTESETPQSADIQISISDCQLTTTVGYTVTGTAQNGGAYEASWGDNSITFPDFGDAGTYDSDITVTTANNIPASQTLTVTLASDPAAYQIDGPTSVQITFQPHTHRTTGIASTGTADPG